MDKANSHKILEYVFYKNKYNEPIIFTRQPGYLKYNYGYPTTLDGLVELERGKTIGGPCLIKFYNALRAKYADQLTDINMDK